MVKPPLVLFLPGLDPVRRASLVWPLLENILKPSQTLLANKPLCRARLTSINPPLPSVAKRIRLNTGATAELPDQLLPHFI